MAEQTQIIEGPWEEITKHAAELSGRRVKVTFLPEQKVLHQPEGALEGEVTDEPSGCPIES